MTIEERAKEERAKEPERLSADVRPFIPRSAGSASRGEQVSRPWAKGRNLVGNDDDPGPSAA
jgi:hypothetical protein